MLFLIRMEASISCLEPPRTIIFITEEFHINKVASDSAQAMRIAFFGHFGWTNLGNECTLQVALQQFRRLDPDCGFVCICTGPDVVTKAYNISAVPTRTYIFKPWIGANPLLRLVRKALIAVPSEICRWLHGFRTLRGTDALIVPGTGLLTDAFGLFGWGPCDMFRWSLTAKLCRCKVLFVNVGAGPVYSRIGRFCVRAALSIADFRSYRDEASRSYLNSMGFSAARDRIYPDLVFSLDAPRLAGDSIRRAARPVIGLGVMQDAGRYGVGKADSATYQAYLDTLAQFAKWLVGRGYDVRLLIGDFVDRDVIPTFRSLLTKRLCSDEEKRIIDDSVTTVDDLLWQISTTEFVVGTRFHNLVLSIILCKPVLAISFHHKCVSLMNQMGLERYCQDINCVSFDKLVEQFCHLEQNADSVKQMLATRIARCRAVLDEQYGEIVGCLHQKKYGSERTLM